MIIRKVRKTDNVKLARIIRGVFDEHGAPKEGTVYTDPTTDELYEQFEIENSVLWVAETNEGVVGCCGIYPTKGLPIGCAELVKFYLDQNARGKGVGKELMERSVNSAKEMGYKELYIESLPHYEKAVNMYRKQGFKSLNAPLGDSGHVTCNIWMLKHL